QRCWPPSQNEPSGHGWGGGALAAGAGVDEVAMVGSLAGAVEAGAAAVVAGAAVVVSCAAAREANAAKAIEHVAIQERAVQRMVGLPTRGFRARPDITVTRNLYSEARRAVTGRVCTVIRLLAFPTGNPAVTTYRSPGPTRPRCFSSLPARAKVASNAPNLRRWIAWTPQVKERNGTAAEFSVSASTG